MNTATQIAAQLHRASMVSPFFFVLGDSTKNGAPIAISPNQERTFGFTTPSGKTLRVLRLQYITYDFANGKYTLGPLSNRVQRFTSKRYLNVKIIDGRKTILMEDNVQSSLQTNTKVVCNNAIFTSSEIQPGHLRLKRILPPLSQFSVEVTNNSTSTLYFNGLLVALGVDK